MPLRDLCVLRRVSAAFLIDPAYVVLSVTCGQRPHSIRGDDELFCLERRKEPAWQTECSSAPCAALGSRLHFLNKALPVLRCQHRGDRACRIRPAVETHGTSRPPTAPIRNSGLRVPRSTS